MNLQNLRKVTLDAGLLTQEIRQKSDKDPEGRRLGNADFLRWNYQSSLTQTQLANELLFALQGLDGDNRSAGQPKNPRATPEYVNQFIKALKVGANPKGLKGGRSKGFERLLDAMTELGEGGAEGGFLAPLVFDGMVYALSRNFADLGAMCADAPVNSIKGWRAVEEAAPADPLEPQTENVEWTPETESPEFTQQNFQLHDYAGFLKVVANLFDDTPVAIMAYLTKWFARKVALRNDVIVKALVDANLTPVVPAGNGSAIVIALRTALITTLDPIIAANSAIIVNPTGLNILEELEDGVGDPIMGKDWILSQRQVVTVPASVWADAGGKTPVFVGDLSEFATRFYAPFQLVSDGGQGKESWRFHNIEVKAILRTDIPLNDVGAGVLIHLPTS